MFYKTENIRRPVNYSMFSKRTMYWGRHYKQLRLMGLHKKGQGGRPCTWSESNGQSIATLTVINSNFLPRRPVAGAVVVCSCGCVLCVGALGKEVFRKVNPPTLSSRRRCYFNHLPFGKFVISIGRRNIDRIHVTIDDCSALVLYSVLGRVEWPWNRNQWELRRRCGGKNQFFSFRPVF